MPTSVRSQTSSNHPGITESTIRQASRSKIKDSFVWIVAEGDDDAKLYGRMYDSLFVKALPSTIEKGNNSCVNVEKIVANILSNTSINIIGIRDKDYTLFTGYSRPQNIFLTDRRDIEMQIIESKWNNITSLVLANVINDIIVYSKQVGLYRIFNDRYNLSFSFDSLHVNNYWDFSQKKLKQGWNTQLEGSFFNGIVSSQSVTQLKQKYNTFISRLNVATLSPYDICQGHGFVSLLKGLGPSQLNQLDKELFKWYSKSDYSSSQLAIDIKSWANQHSCQM